MKKFLRGVDLPRKEESGPMVPATADVTPVANISGATDVPEVQPIPKPMLEKKAPMYARWEKVLHPSQLVLAAGEIPKPAVMLKLKGKTQQLVWTISISPPLCLLKAPLLPASPPPARALALRWLPTPPSSYARVTACLKTPEVMQVGQETPMGSMSIGLVLTPSISGVSSSHMVKDDMAGLVYMDTMTTSIGRVILCRSDSNKGPVIEDITDQSWEALLKICHWADEPSPIDTPPNFLETHQ